MPQANGVLTKIIDNAYKIDLSKEFIVSITFKVRDLTSYMEDNEELDLKPNPIQPRQNDVHHGNKRTRQEQVDWIIGPITQVRSKTL